jgi:HlyD family secretion protein
MHRNLNRRTALKLAAGAGALAASGRLAAPALAQAAKPLRFVPQANLPSIHIGDRVLIHCDGCPDDLFARVRFISAQAEFTPPVIYSLEERARLVFRIEAIPEQPEDVRIGQPATVALQSSSTPETIHAQK